MNEWWWLLTAVLAAATIGALITLPTRAARRVARLARARKEFHAQREWLEVKFVQLAGASPRRNCRAGEDCDFDDDVAYVRNRTTSELSAFVAVTVAVGDGGNSGSGVSSLSGIRVGTAIFRFDNGHW